MNDDEKALTLLHALQLIEGVDSLEDAHDIANKALLLIEPKGDSQCVQSIKQ
jgi:hypothetical protein